MSEANLLRLLLRKFTLRHWRREPGQASLLVIILALGIAVYFSIRLANRAVLTSFERFTDVLTHETDFVISAPAGSLPDSVLPEIRAALGARPVHIIPVIESTASRPRENSSETLESGDTFRLVGIDLIGIQNLREVDDSTETARDVWAGGFDKLGAIFVSPNLTTPPGDRLQLLIDDRSVSLEIAGRIPHRRDQPTPPASLIIMDLPAAQSLLERAGQLDRVEFLVEPGPNRDARRAEAARIVTEISRGRWLVESSTDRRASGAMMTRAFRLNLTILSLIALIVGLYLIYQALDGAVLRRRLEIAILRSLGVEEKTIRRAWLAESLLVGIVGGILGALLGWLGAQIAVRFVGRTVNALYFASSAESARLHPGEFACALALSIAASIAAGWAPAHAAAKMPPAQLLGRHHTSSPGPRVLRSRSFALALIILGAIAASWPALHLKGGTRIALGGYFAAGAWLFAGGIASGHFLRALGELARPLGKFSPFVRLAVSHLAPPSGRHRLAAASLACAVAMTAGMAILVGSFERTMQQWIATTLQADLYVSSAGAQSASSENRIRSATWKQIANDPAVADVNVLHATEVVFSGGSALVIGVNAQFDRRQNTIAWLGETPTHWPDEGDFAFVSEAFIERFGAHRDDSLTMPTPDGAKTLRIAGIFADYGSERGSVIIDRTKFMQWFGDDSARSVIVKLRDSSSAETLRVKWLAQYPALQIFTNAHLRTEVLRIFRQTFSITYALEAIGVCVAVLGLALTLVSVILDRQADLTTLRALGVSRRNMAASTAMEGLGTALAGLLTGLITSLLLGWLLIHVINKQTFGWTLLLSIPMPIMAILAALVLIAALVASVLVGYWGSGLPADREE